MDTPREDDPRPDPRLDALLRESGHAWPRNDAQLDAWLASQQLDQEEQGWLRRVIQARISEAQGAPALDLGPVDPVDVEPLDAPVSASKTAAPEAALRRPRRLAATDLALLNAQLLELIEAGLPLPRGLRQGALELQGGRLAVVVEELGRDLEAGLPLSQALARRGDALPPVYQALVAAGEATGDLIGTLELLREQAEVDAELDRRVRESLAYPALVVGVALVGVVALAFGLAPRFEALWDALTGVDYGRSAELPLSTTILFGVSGFVRTMPWAAVALLIGLLLAGRAAWRRFVPPLLSSLLAGRDGARGLAELSRVLAGFLRRGVPLPAALRGLRETPPGLPPGALDGVLERVEAGSSLGDALRVEPAFPSTYAWIVGAAEARGDLAPALLALARRYEREVEGRLKLIETLVGPVGLACVGLFVGFSAFAVYAPLFEIQKHLQQ